MFETSVVHAQAQPARSRIGLLTVSVIAHSAVILGALVFSVASVDFPRTAPDEVANAPLFPSIQIPPPLGNPNGGAQPKAAPPVQKKQEPAPTQQTAPQVVPDELPSLDPPSSGTETSTGPATGTEPGPVGQPWGVEGSLGDPNALPSTDTNPPAKETIYAVTGDVKAPVIITKVDPRYPEPLRKTGMTAIVVVSCVIDKNGRVRDPEIIKPALPPFNNEVMRVISQWRYKPGTLRGQPVETYMTLTVRFTISR
jgi:protein TonB